MYQSVRVSSTINNLHQMSTIRNGDAEQKSHSAAKGVAEGQDVAA
jgi:hypothetical protein